MDSLDHFIKHNLGIKYYGRYVDDFVIVHNNKEFLKSLLPIITHFLQSELNLTLHPKKIYLQHYNKGVKYIGAVIKPNRIYIANRTLGNFYNSIQKYNKIIKNYKPTKTEQETFQSSINSYLGIMKHYKSYNIRKKIVFDNLAVWWFNYVYLNVRIEKFILVKKN